MDIYGNPTSGTLAGGEITGDLGITGELTIGNSPTDYTFPSTAGTAGQVLTETGGATLVWQTPTGAGDVVGPTLGATDEAICRYDGASGTLIQNSLASISDTGILSAPVLSTPTLQDTTGTSTITLDATTVNITATNLQHNGVDIASSGDVSSGSLFYLNRSVASDIPTYYTLETNQTGTGQISSAFTLDSAAGIPKLILNFATTELNTLLLPQGLSSLGLYCFVDNATGTTSIKYEIYKRNAAIETLLQTSANSVDIDSTSALDPTYIHLDLALISAPLVATDRLVIKIYGTKTSVANRTLNILFEGATYYSHWHSTFTGLEKLVVAPVGDVVDNSISLFDGISGKLIKQSSASISGNTVSAVDLDLSSSLIVRGDTMLSQLSTPPVPDVSYNKVYFKSDDEMYILAQNGTESKIQTEIVNPVVYSGAQTNTHITQWNATGDLVSSSLRIDGEAIKNVGGGAGVNLSGTDVQISSIGSVKVNVGASNVTIGTGVNNWTLPYSRGTIGQVLVDSGSGVMAFDDLPTINPNFIAGTGLVNDNAMMVWDSTSGVSAKNSNLIVGSGSITNGGTSISMDGATAIVSGDAVALWADGSEKLSVDTFNVNIGGAVSGYKLPTLRGSVDYVLKSNGAGIVSWQKGVNPPLTSTQNMLTMFDATDGSEIKDSGFSVSGDGIFKNNGALELNVGESQLSHTTVVDLSIGAIPKLIVDADKIEATVPLQVVDGSAVAPAVSFTSEPTTGIYRAGASDMRVSVNNNDLIKFNSAAVTPAPAVDALISQYGNSSGSFSVRKVIAVYEGDCMAVSSIEGTTQIPFDATGQVSYAVFSGLTEPVYITTWYDQSGFGRHLTGEALVGGVLPRLLFETVGTNQRPTIRFALSRFISSVSSDAFGLNNSDHAYSVLFNTVAPITSVTFLLSNAIESSRNDLSLQGAGSGARCINDASIADIGAPYAYSDANWHVLVGGARSTGFQSSMVRAEGIQVVGSAGGQISTIHPLVIGTRLDFNNDFAFPGDICEVVIFDQQWIESSVAWTTYYTNAIDYMENGISSELSTTSLGPFISPKLIIPSAMGNDFQYQMGLFEGYQHLNTGQTNIAIAGTPVKVNFSNFQVGVESHFSVATGVGGGTITYNGMRPRYVHAGVTVSFVCDQKDSDIEMFIKQNTTILDQSYIKLNYDNNLKHVSSAIHYMALLSPGDTIELWANCTNKSTILTCTEVNLFGMAAPVVV